MRRAVIGFAVGWGIAWAAYRVLTVNPLWFHRNVKAPVSVPEWLVTEARRKGAL